VAGRGLTVAETLHVAAQIADALAASHAAGILHRDLKPDNVFLCPTDLGGEVRDVVKVLDFGISKIRGSNTVLTQDAALLGTPQYMAPEQATGRNDEIDARTDVFAFGAMTFEMLAGKPPFTGDTLAAVIHAIVYTPTPSLAALAPDTPPAIVAAIERAMDKNRDARFPDVNSFVKAVTSRSLATAPTVAAASAAPVQVVVPTERVERQRSSASFFIILGVAAAASITFAWWKTRPREPEETPLPSQTSTATPAPAAAPTPAPAPSRAPAPAPEAKAEPAPEAKSEPAPKPGAKAKATDGAKAKEAAAISPEAARDLDEAEAALGAGKPGEALRLAQHSLYAQKSSRAYALIARARCAEGDLGNAKAALAQVAARDRAAVVRGCGKLGVDLH